TFRVHDGQQRLAAQGADLLVAPIERPAERGLRLVQKTAHPRVLRSLAGEEEGDLGSSLPLDVPPREPRGSAARREGFERSGGGGSGGGDDRGAIGEVRPPDVRGEGCVAEVQPRIRSEARGQSGGNVAKRGF